MKNIRNFVVLAHIDHGKSTLADRFLEITKTISKEKLQQAQYLDRMSLERERGITIKLHPVRMIYSANRRPTQIEPQTNAENDFLYKDITYKIRGAAFSVKKNLGLGQKEIIYQRALEAEFEKVGLNYIKEKIIDLWYENKKIGTYRPDFVVDEKVIVEIKALPFIGQTEGKQLWGYLKNSPYKLALLINFSGKDVEIKRVVYDTARLRESAYSQRESAKVEEYILNLIDTPGHVDFSYEVSRSLNACEGAILLCDATQGIQAQTLANYYLAKEEGLVIIPVVNKIDLPNAQPEKVGRELAELVGVEESEIIFISAKSGVNVEEVLEAIVKKIPPPTGNVDEPLRALVFDSLFDQHRGVIAYVRIFDGKIKKGEEIKLLGTGKISTILEVGTFNPNFFPKESLEAGESGYIITGFKGIRDCRVGDTVTKVSSFKFQVSSFGVEPLKGYKEPQPMVFASFYCTDSSDYLKFKEALEKLSLNDAAFTFKSEVFSDLGFGFRCGFLGMLHMEIIKERLEREYNLDLIITAPSVSYKVILENNQERFIHSPQEFPDASEIKEIQEPWVRLDVFSPVKYLSPIMDLVKNFRGIYKKTEYLAGEVILFYEMPLASFLDNFYDGLKNISAGYASLSYHFIDYRPGDLVKMDIMIAGKKADALSFIIPKKEIQFEGKRLTMQLKKVIPRQMFEIAIQAAVGSQIISRETVPAMKKNVVAKLHGGDRTRKQKLWKKQKAGKEKLKRLGTVDVPQEAFFAILKNR